MKKNDTLYKKVICILVISALLISNTDIAGAAAKTRYTGLANTQAPDASERTPEPSQPALQETPGVNPGQTVIPASAEPSITPSAEPSVTPSAGPSVTPSAGPSVTPSAGPSVTPSAGPTTTPSARPTATAKPTHKPTPTPKPTPEPDKTPFKISVKKAGKEKLAISWSKRKSASRYKVWQKKQGAKKWKLIKTTKALKYNVKIKTGRYYKYKVTAIFRKKKVMARTETVVAGIPDKAADIIYKRTGTHKIRISWSRGKCTKSFIVYRKSKNGGYKKEATIKKARFNADAIATGKKYVYKIVPVYDNKKVKIYGSNTYINVLLKDEINTNKQNYGYEELCSDISALKKLYGSRFHYNVAGQSADGRNIYEIVVGNPYADQTILVVAQLHAREYMTSQLCMKQIEYYLQNYNDTLGGVKVSDVLSKVAIHYIPMANPDGAEISQHGFSAIRNKSLRKKLMKMPGSGNPSLWKANARGVDLNKNYPYNYVAKQGTRGSEGFTGPGKNSEPETKAISALIDRLISSSTVRGEINYHATGSIIFGDYEGPLKKTITEMYNLACDITGYSSAAGYSSRGDGKSVGNLREYVMYKKKLPSITLEIGKSACPLPISEFKDIWVRNRNVVLREAELLMK